MPLPSRPPVSLADLVALSAALEHDERLSRSDVARRDRRIGREVGADTSDRLSTSLAWLDGLCREDAELRKVRERVRAVLHGAGFLVALVGLVAGWTTALGVFYYDGSGRINAVGVLAVFVLLPAVLLVPFVLAAVPPRWVTWLPGATALSAISRGLSPGRLGRLLLRRLPRAARESWERVSGQMDAHHRLFAGVEKWAILRWSQVFALAFQAAALSATMCLVVFTDLAFGWSTTLTSGDPGADAAWLHSLTSALAAPWAWAFEGASPSLELIRVSRYYRVSGEMLSSAQAAQLGGWWPFVVLSMLAYGLMPRVVTLAFAHACLGTKVRAAIAGLPGMPAVLRRLHHAQVQTVAIEPEAVASAAPPGDRAPVSSAAPSSFSDVVNWAGVPVDAARLAGAFEGAAVHPAGGASPVEADQALARRLGAHGGEERDIAIVVKAWEPPLMEFLDFLQSLREGIGKGRQIVVMPLGMDGAGGLADGEAAQVDVWRRKLAGCGDPWLRVASIHEEARP